MNDRAVSLKFAAYFRKSSEAKERQIASIGDQRKESEDVIGREGLTVVASFEESKSAFKPDNRPEFDKMMAMIRRGEANAIISWKEDRICRNPKEGGEILQYLQDGLIKEIRCTATGTVYTPDSDHLILQIHFGMANQYSRNISSNVRRALKYKVQRGEYFRAAPLGYVVVGEFRGTKNIKPHPFEAPLIKKAYQLASTGFHSMGYIAAELFKEGLRTKKGKPLHVNHLHRILQNPLYYGYFLFQNELYKGTYEPLVSKELFDVVQDAIRDRTVPKINSWKHAYNGLLKCSLCGCSITTSVKQKFYKGTNRHVLYIYHHCTKRRGKCTQPPISTISLEKEFIDEISKISINEEVFRLGLDLLKAKHVHQVSTEQDNLQKFRKEYDSIQDRLNRLVRMRADEELTADEFKEQKNLLMQERAGVEEKIKNSRNSSDEWLERTEKFLNTAFYARDVMKNGTVLEKRNLIIDVGCDLLLNNGEIVMTYRKPYDVLLLPEYSSNWQGCEELNLS